MSMGCHSVEETFFAQPMDFAAFKTPLPVSTSEATAATIVTPPAISNSSPTHLVSSRRRSSWTSVSTKKPYLNGVKANSQHHKLFLRTADTLLTPPTTPPALLPSKRLVKVECQVRARIPTPAGEMFLHLYKNTGDNKEHLAVVYGNDIRSKSLDTPRPGETEMDRIVRGAYTGRLRPDESGTSLIVSPSPTNHQQPLSSPLVRIHSECFTGETVQSARCDCGEQLQEAMRLIQEEGCGVVVYLRQEGRGIGLADKLRAYNLQDLGHDTVTANLMLHHPPDLRNYDIATQILADLGLTKVRLLTNNPDKIEQLEGEGVKVVERIPMVPHAWKHDYDPNRLGSEMDQYLKVKVERMRHLLNIPEALLS